MLKPEYIKECLEKMGFPSYFLAERLNVDEKIKNIYKGKKYFLRTYGCQMNVHDSEAIASYLEKLGFTKTDVLEQSDIVVLNTCAIREMLMIKYLAI